MAGPVVRRVAGRTTLPSTPNVPGEGKKPKRSLDRYADRASAPPRPVAEIRPSWPRSLEETVTRLCQPALLDMSRRITASTSRSGTSARPNGPSLAMKPTL